MPIYHVPTNLRKFDVAKGKDGSFVVFSREDETVVIACRDESQAIDVAAKLRKPDREEAIQVNLLDE
jgi:hypothetical protein